MIYPPPPFFRITPRILLKFTPYKLIQTCSKLNEKEEFSALKDFINHSYDRFIPYSNNTPTGTFIIPIHTILDLSVKFI